MNERKSTPFGRAIDRARNNPNSVIAIRQLQKFVEGYYFSLGLNYRQLFEMAHKLSGVDLDEWDSLLYEMN